MKAGDKVKCIDNQMLESVFNLDDTYIISYAHPDGLHISIENLGRAMYHADRFELIEEESMSVNGVELKEGQKWRTLDYGVVTLVKPGLNDEYPWKFIAEGFGDALSITADGKYWADDKEPILLDLIVDGSVQNTFNPKSEPTKFVPPKPGDKIICNNGEEFTCCTKQFLNSVGLAENYDSGSIFGYQEAPEKNYYKYDWTFWDANGKKHSTDWSIREVIPQESLIDSKELLYTVEEVTEAFANALHLSWMGGHQEGVNKVKDYLSKKHNAEYQEYLRLRAIYE